MNIQAQVATEEEIKAKHRQCWWTGCKGRAFLKDWGGWQWCFSHWYLGMKELGVIYEK